MSINNHHNNTIKQNGFTLVEIVIACSIISVLIFGLMKATERGIVMSNFTLNKSQANFLIEEGAESVKSIRDDDWANISGLTINTPYYLSFNSITNKWELTTTPNKVDSFTRSIVFNSVSRDSNDDIVNTGRLS